MENYEILKELKGGSFGQVTQPHHNHLSGLRCQTRERRSALCNQKSQLTGNVWTGLPSHRTGSRTFAKIKTHEYSHIQGLLHRWEEFLQHCDGVLLRRWSLHQDPEQKRRAFSRRSTFDKLYSLTAISKYGNGWSKHPLCFNTCMKNG